MIRISIAVTIIDYQSIGDLMVKNSDSADASLSDPADPAEFFAFFLEFGFIFFFSKLLKLDRLSNTFNFNHLPLTEGASDEKFSTWCCTDTGPSEFSLILSIFINLFCSQFFYM